MANKMSIGIGVKLDDIATTQSNLQAELNKISKNLSLNLGTIKIEDLNKTTEQIKQQLKKLNDTTKVTPTLDTTIAKQSLNEYANLVKNKIKEIEGQTSKISSIKISTDRNGSILGANATVGIDNADKKVLKFNQDLKLVRNTFTENDAKEKAMFDRQNEYLDKAISKLNQYKQVINTSNNGSISNKNQTTSEINNQINKINELKNANTLLGNAEKTRINESINGLKSETSALTQHQHGFSSMLSMMTQYAGVGAIVYGAMNQLKQGLSDINNIDDALRNLKRVSDDVSNTTLNNFVGKANEMGISLGRTTEDALTATATFKQLGYSFEEASKYMANNSLILSNVGDMSASDSASSLVSILKGFRLEAQDTTKVVDILNETGNKFAITTGDLTEGLRIGGASLALANNDLAQSTALITTGTEILRDSNMVANGLKNISMRIRGVKDDEGELVPKMREDLQNIANVDIKDVNGGFKSTYEIIKSLGERWNDTKNPLTDLQKAGLAEEVAGKQRANVFASLMQNYKQLEKVYETAGNSAGSAQKEQNAYMDSISGKLNTFKETVKATWISLTDTNGIKSILTVSADVVGGLNNVIKTIGAMPTIIMGVVGAMTLFNTKFRESATSYQPAFFSNWISGLNNIKTKLSETVVNQKAEIEVTKLMIQAHRDAGISTNGLQGQLATMQKELVATTFKEIACTVATGALQIAFTMGLSLAITGIITGLTTLGSWLLTTGDKMTDCSTQADALAESLKTIEGTKDLVDQYETLNKSLEEGNKSEQEKKDINDEISKVKESLIGLDDDYGWILKDQNKTYEEQLSLLKSIYEQKAKENAKTLDKEMDSQGTADGIGEKLKNDIALYKNIKNALNSPNSDGTVSYNGFTVSAKTAEETIGKVQDELKGYYVDLESYNHNVQQLKDANYTTGRSFVDMGEDVKSFMVELNGTSTDKKVKVNIDTNNIKIAENAFKELSDSGKISETTVLSLAKAYPTMGINAENAKAKVEELNKAIKGTDNAKAPSTTDLTKSYSDAISKASDLKTLSDELNKSETMTPELVSKVASAIPDIGSKITNVNAIQEILNSKIKEQAVIAQESYLQMEGDDEQFYQDKIANSSEFQSAYNTFLNSFNAEGQKAYDIDYGNYNTLNKLKEGTQNDLGTSIKTWLGQFVDTSAKGYFDDFDNFKDLASKKQEVLKLLKSEMDKINQAMATMTQNIAEQAKIADNATDTTRGLNAEKLYGKDLIALQNLADKQKEVQGGIDGFNANFDNFALSTKGFTGGNIGGGTTKDSGGSSNKKGASDSEKEADDALKKAEEWQKKIDDLKSDVKDIDMYQDANNVITQLDNTMTALKTSEEGLTGVDLANAKKKEIDVMNQQIDAQKRLQSLQEIEKGNIENTLSQYGILTDSTGNLSNAYSVLAQKRQEAESMVGSSEPEFEAKKKALQVVKDINDEVIKYGEITNKTIPETIDKWEQLTNTVKKANDEMKKANEDLINTEGEKLVNALKKEYEDKKTKELKKLKDDYQDDVDDLQDEIDTLQKRLDSLNDSSLDNETKLAKLKAEKALWEKELESGNNVFAKSKVNALDSSISDLEKTITKNNLQSQIDILNKQKSSREDDYNDEVQSVQDKYDKLEDEHKLYAKASQLLTTKNIKKIKELLNSQDESFKQIGTKLGESLNNPIQTEVNNTISAIDKLIDKVNKLDDIDSNGQLSKTTNSGKSYKVDANGVVLLGDITPNEYEASTSSSASSKKSNSSKSVTNSNGSKTTYNSDNTTTTTSKDGKVTETSGKYSNGTNYTIVKYDTGGRTPSNIDSDGAIAILHADEKILNQKETEDWSNAIDKINNMSDTNIDLSKIDEIYNYITTSSALLGQSSQYSNVGNLPMLTLGTDLNKIASSVINNTNTDNSIIQPVQMSIAITNNNGSEAVMNEKSLEKMINKVVQKSATKYGGKGFVNR